MSVEFILTQSQYSIVVLQHSFVTFFLYCMWCTVLYLKELYILKIRTCVEILAENGSYVKCALTGKF